MLNHIRYARENTAAICYGFSIYSGIFTPTVDRESVANRGCIFASVPNVVQHFVPMLDVPAVRRLLAPGDRDVTIFGEREKRALAGQRKRRCPVWRKPHETFSR